MITSYKELSFSKYQKILAIVENGGNIEDYQPEILAILTDQSVDEVLHLPLMEYQTLVKASEFLFEEPKKTEPVQKVYRVGKFELKPVRDIRRLTTSQYIDFQAFSKDAENKIVEILSVFMVPVGSEYADMEGHYGKPYDVMEVQDAIREHLPITDAVALFAFFLHSFETLIGALLICSGWILKIQLILSTFNRERRAQIKEAQRQVKALKKQKRNWTRSLIVGGGLPTWTPSRRLREALGIMSGE